MSDVVIDAVRCLWGAVFSEPCHDASRLRVCLEFVEGLRYDAVCVNGVAMEELLDGALRVGYDALAAR